MEKGTKVAISNANDAHPRIRGRHGVVQGPGYCGSVLVKLDPDGYETNVDQSLLEVLPQPVEATPTTNE